MDIRIVEATPDDDELLSALAVQTYTTAFGHSMSAANLAAHLESNLTLERFRKMLRDDVFLLAHVEGEVVGFVQFGDAHVDDSDLNEQLRVRPGD